MDTPPLWQVIAAALAAVNAITFVLFGFDKRRARAGKRRVRERTLLAWCAAGGWPCGFLAMRTFRHKTRDTKFLLGYWMSVALWVLAVAAWFATGR